MFIMAGVLVSFGRKKKGRNPPGQVRAAARITINCTMASTINPMLKLSQGVVRAAFGASLGYVGNVIMGRLHDTLRIALALRHGNLPLVFLSGSPGEPGPNSAMTKFVGLLATSIWPRGNNSNRIFDRDLRNYPVV